MKYTVYTKIKTMFEALTFSCNFNVENLIANAFSVTAVHSAMAFSKVEYAASRGSTGCKMLKNQIQCLKQWRWKGWKGKVSKSFICFLKVQQW